MTGKSMLMLRGLPLDPSVLRRSVDGRDERTDRLSRLLIGDAAGYGGLTVGDLLYDAFRIDPMAVQGIDFARAADLSDIFRFSAFARDLTLLEGARFAGNLAQLHGYVAERIAASALIAEGADVTFPSTSTEPGWDLLVNGERFQVKCLGSPAGVHEHLERYPDIPVITNCELAPFFTHDDRVVPLTSMSHTDVVATTKSTLDAGADLLDLQIPLIATAVAAARVGFALLRRESDPFSAISAGVAQAAGSTAGGKVGSVATAAGLGLLGVTGGWILVIGPAFGAVAGMWGANVLTNVFGRAVLCRGAANALDQEMRAFAGAAAAVVQQMLESAEQYRASLDRFRHADGAFASAVYEDWCRRADQEIEHRAFYRDKLLCAEHSPGTIDPDLREPRAIASRLIWTVARAGVVPANVRSPLEQLTGSVDAYGRALKRWLLR